MARAARHSIGNISPRLAAADALPFPDAHFDAAYLVTVLGEIPQPQAALAELRRVPEPGGRLVIGEFADRYHEDYAEPVRPGGSSLRHRRSRTCLIILTRGFA